MEVYLTWKYVQRFLILIELTLESNNLDVIQSIEKMHTVPPKSKLLYLHQWIKKMFEA